MIKGLLARIFAPTPKPDSDASFLRDCAEDYRRSGDEAEARILERIADKLEKGDGQ